MRAFFVGLVVAGGLWASSAVPARAQAPRVAVLAPDTAEGDAIRGSVAAALAERGWTVVDPDAVGAARGFLIEDGRDPTEDDLRSLAEQLGATWMVSVALRPSGTGAQSYMVASIGAGTAERRFGEAGADALVARVAGIVAELVPAPDAAASAAAGAASADDAPADGPTADAPADEPRVDDTAPSAPATVAPVGPGTAVIQPAHPPTRPANAPAPRYASRPMIGLLVPGIVLFAVGYLGAVATAAFFDTTTLTSGHHEDPACHGAMTWGYVPFAGPLISAVEYDAAREVGGDPCWGSGFVVLYGVVGSVFQIGGLTMAILGAVIQQRTPLAATLEEGPFRSIALLPDAPGAQAGLSVELTF